ncbi:MAG: hypothetical protein FJ276_20175 [Planctomycetes bacterium]|nr:hypothetical protein [Planctomycetota bacterium]
MIGCSLEQMLRRKSRFLVRDFVETADGLLFAVVANGLEDRRVLACLRYVRTDGGLRKLDTLGAHQFLGQHHPEYLFHSARRDITVHGVPPDRIAHHHRPSSRWREIASQPAGDDLLRKVQRLASLFGLPADTADCPGVTGSVLVGAHTERSDIDLVAYGRASFQRARQLLRRAVEAGVLEELTESLWRDAYARRGCSLTFEEYLWHEKRKFTKCAVVGTKVDLNAVMAEPASVRQAARKLRQTVIRAVVHDASAAFDYPAIYRIRHPAVREIVCFTPTYAGQARAAEVVQAAGWLEQSHDGRLRLVIGTSREADGEYLRVVS